MSNFEFNAPQFVNFCDEDDPKADRFFATTPTIPNSTIKSKDTQSSKKNFTVLRKVLHEIVTHQIQSDKNIPNTQGKDYGKDIIQQFEKLQLSEVKSKKSRGPLKATELFSDVRFPGSEKKSHTMMTRLDTANQISSSKHLLGSLHSEDSENSCLQLEPKGKAERISSKKIMMKENIFKAEPCSANKENKPMSCKVESSGSPPFRAAISKTCGAKSNCMPKTPNLLTKYRQRKVNFPNEKEREEMELEEMKKHQVKANPLNEKILMGPCLNLKAPILKKPVTVPQPFSLTEVKKKEPPLEPVFHFKAQPVPTSILNGPVGIPQKRVVSPTVPTTPHIKVPSRFRVEAKSQEKTRNNEGLCLPRNTKIEPFSFDARMKDLLHKKEEFVKKVIEEEKKGFSSFKAHPMPDFKSKTELPPLVEKAHHKTVPQPFNLTQVKGNKSFSEDHNAIRVTPFKARTASVVHQKPFVPKLQKHETQLPIDFQLNTEIRAAKRQKFDEKIKQKEEEVALILKFQKEEEERLEKEKALEERKKAEFKARPMPRYKVFEIHGAELDKLTAPRSPNFSTKTRRTKHEA